jgi:hypothetical protein
MLKRLKELQLRKVAEDSRVLGSLPVYRSRNSSRTTRLRRHLIHGNISRGNSSFVVVLKPCVFLFEIVKYVKKTNQHSISCQNSRFSLVNIPAFPFSSKYSILFQQ